MFLLFILEFIAFPERSDAMISANRKTDDIVVESSGSMGLSYSGKCFHTHPNDTLIQNRESDWCSNLIEKDSNNKIWIQYSLKHSSIRVTGYSLRNGCGYHLCCCLNDNTIIKEYCCCRIYIYSFLGSNDNKTWKTIHKVEKDVRYYPCLYKTFTFNKTEPFKFLRIQADETFPRCPKCLQLNEIEIHGEEVPFDEIFSEENNEFDESISIIGKVTKGDQN